MAYYNVCPNCGSALDPGEKCDCNNEKQEKQELMEEMVKANAKTGQYEFIIAG